MADKGARVPSPLRSQQGDLAVSMEANNEPYIVCAFRLLQGKHWDKNNPSLWNRAIFYNWGKAVGDMHHLTKDYKPSDDKNTRDEFHIHSMINDNIKTMPSVNRIADILLDEIALLPKDKDSYGLIHNDLHPDNFLIDGEHINLFDFDGCAYSWYAFDIGNALYIALWFGRSNDDGVDFTNDIIRYFLKGYLSANYLNDFWLSKIPLFMMCCKIALFSFGCDSETLNDDEYQKVQMHNIESNILFTGCAIDYSLFKND